MISTIKLTGPNVNAFCSRIKTEGFGCLDRMDSMTICRMLLGIATDRFGESSVVDITNGILNSCGDQSHELGMVLTNRYKLGMVWKFIAIVNDVQIEGMPEQVTIELQLSKIPHPENRNAIRLTLQYDTVAKELDGTEYPATVSRPLIEYTSDKITTFKSSDKQNFEKGKFNDELLHPKPVEPEPEPEPEEEPSNESLDPESDTDDEEEPGPLEEPESSTEEQEPEDDGSGKESPAPDEPGDGDEPEESEGDDAGEPESGGTDGDEAPGVEETATGEAVEVAEPEPSMVKGSHIVIWTEYKPFDANSTEDVSAYAQEGKEQLYDDILDIVSSVPNCDDPSSFTEAALTKLLESPIAQGQLLDRKYHISGVRVNDEGPFSGYVVEILIHEDERKLKELEEAMNSDKGNEKVKTDYVDITDPEYRNGTLLAMFGTTAPSANHVHTFLNEFHTSQKTKSFLETKVDGQGTYPTESDVFYDNIVWAFVKMKDGKFWRIAIANRDFSLSDESWIATHHIPGRWATIAEVQDGPSHYGYRRRNW